MIQSPTRTGAKHFLAGSLYALGAIGGFAFLFGGGLIHAIWNVDRFLGELMGIGIAIVCLVGGAVAKHAIDDIEWREANEEAVASESNTKPESR